MEELKPVPANSSPLTPLGFLERAATAYGDSISVIYNSTTYTWSQTHRRCLQLASAISALGIRHPDVVSVLAPNLPAMYELQFAVPMAGAVLNNLNTRLDARTLYVLLRHSESKLLFVEVLSQSLAAEAISMFPPGTSPPKLVLVRDDHKATRSEPSPFLDFVDTYEGMLSGGDPGFRWVGPRSEWEPIVLNYTSGTTASPKGVVHCHRGFFIAAVNSLVDWSVPTQPVFLWTLPMFHSNGWGFPYAMAAVGGTNVCIRRVEASVVYNMISRHRVTHMCAAPVVLNMLVNSPHPVDHPVKVLTGGSPPPAPVVLQAESMGFVLSHGYGMTEAIGCVVTCAWKLQWNRLPATDRSRLKARQGVRTICLTEVDVVDPSTGRSVKPDGLALGEVVLRGGSVMLGYYKDPEATRRCLRDGWLYTGDMAVMHPDGYMEIKDRSNDVIISGGENISSVEVESVIYTHPAVNEAAVVGRPDNFWGETPCAFVSLRKGEGYNEGRSRPTEKDLVEFCRNRLPHYMVPKTVVIKEELPKTSTGKIQKFALRKVAKAMDPLTMSSL